MDSAKKSLNDCAIIFQFLGQFYFSFKNLSTQNRDRRPSIGNTIYSIFLFVFLTSSMFLFSMNRKSIDYVENINAKTFFNLLFFNVSLIGWMIDICIGIMQSYWATPLTKRFLLNCLKIAKKFHSDFQYAIDHKVVRNKLILQTVILVAYFVGTTSLYHLFSKFHLIDNSTELKYYFITCPLIFLSAVVLKFIFHVQLINTHLEAVHTVLLDLFPKFTFINVVNGVFVKPVQQKVHCEITSKLKTIAKMYSTVAENAELVNKSMGVTVLTFTTVKVVSTIAGSYRILVAAFGKNPGNIVGKFVSRILCHISLFDFSNFFQGSVYGLIIYVSVLISIVLCCNETKKIVSFTHLH